MRNWISKSAILIIILSMNISSGLFAQRSYTTMPFKIIIGHVSGMQGTYEGYKLLINQTSPDFSYTILLERGVGFCFFINKYVSGIDTNALKNISIQNIDEKNFYKHIYLLNKEREVNNKILIKSIDTEHHDNFKSALNAIYYMTKKVSNEHYQNIADSIYYDSIKVNHIKAKDLIRLIDSTRMSYLMTDDSVLQMLKKNLYLTTDLGAPYTQDWFKGREKIMLSNYNKATFGLNRFCFISDMRHMPNQNGRKAFLKHAELKDFGVECYYPIYFNRFSDGKFRKPFYCLHRKNPMRFNSKLASQFKLKKGAWLMSTKKANYIIISN